MSFGVFMVDQRTKAWAARVLHFGGEREIIPNFLNFAYAQNTGVAFSMMDDHGDTGRFGLSIVAIIAAVLVLFYFWRVSGSRDRLLGALALLLAGIAGNVTDRLRLGFVIDFIQFHYRDWYYPTFNIADAAICVGAGLLILDMILSGRKKKTKDSMPKAL